MELLQTLLPALAGLALIAVAQLFVRPRSPDAATRLFISGGLVLLGPAGRFVPLGPVYEAWPLITVGAVGCAVWGLFLLGDALHPKLEGQQLPSSLEALRGSGEGSPLGGRIVFAVFAVIAVLASGMYFDAGNAAAAALAVVVAILGGHLLHQRGSWAVWVLDRHPEWVVWIYPSKLTVISQRYGTRSVYWRAIVGLHNGMRLMLPAGDEQNAARLAAEVAHVCPKASLGHTGELEARFRMDPASMRKAG